MVEGFSNGVSFFTLILFSASFVIGAFVIFLADTIEALIIQSGLFHHHITFLIMALFGV